MSKQEPRLYTLWQFIWLVAAFVAAIVIPFMFLKIGFVVAKFDPDSAYSESFWYYTDVMFLAAGWPAVSWTLFKAMRP